MGYTMLIINGTKAWDGRIGWHQEKTWQERPEYRRQASLIILITMGMSVRGPESASGGYRKAELQSEPDCTKLKDQRQQAVCVSV